MRNIVAVAALMIGSLFTASVQAHDDDRRAIDFKCIKPGQVICGIGCYLKETGQNVLEGTGMILTAPFRARFCFPKPETYRWTPGYWVPGELHKVEPKPNVLPPRFRYPDNTIPIPYYHEDKHSANPVIVVHRRF